MDAELKAKWLEALRSGKYDQGAGQLRNGTCYCCLGVLCQIFDPNGWRGEQWSYGEGLDESTEMATLPYNFRLRCGISGETESRLINMNDAGFTFSHIADCIEESL